MTTQPMERVKLTKPGDSLVLLVRSVKPETVDRSEYFLISDGVKETLVPQTSLSSQMDRLGVSKPIEIIGKAVRFSRSQKLTRGNKPYWDIDPASDDEAKAAVAASAAVPAPANAGAAGAAPSKPRSYTDLYSKATDFIINTIVPKYRAAKLEPTAADVHAMVATLFIPKSKEN